jgi:osmoprotectant transport system permease protein
MRYLLEHPDRVLQLTIEHIQLVAISTLLATLIGIPVGIMVTRLRWLEAPVINSAGVLYTVPSLALFAMLIPFTGLGRSTAVVALVLCSLLAIVRNTIAGIDAVSPATLDAARGMGMTDNQRLLLVELPLALPIIVAGVRLATVSTIGIATIAAAIGAGGLGRLIFDGIRTFNADRIIAGALMTSVLALVADVMLSWLGDALRPDVAPVR